MKILVINGPNLNLLGQREPGIYGSLTLAQIETDVKNLGRVHGLEVDFLQSNHEGELVDAVQRAGRDYHGAILNAGGYTHTSVAIRDAVLATKIPIVEVHLSNPQARETFRQKSLLAGACVGAISGFGADSYKLAILWFSLDARTKPGDRSKATTAKKD